MLSTRVQQIPSLVDRMARTRFSLGEASGVHDLSNPQRLLDVVVELSEVDEEIMIITGII